jgi:hypothetical protein
LRCFLCSQAAAQQRRLEKSAKQQATEASKERSRKRQRPAAAPAAAAAAATAVIEEAQELDLLPESVLEEMVEAEVNDRRLMERRVVTEELRAALARPARQRQRQKFTERQAGPVTVKVLSSVGDRRASGVRPCCCWGSGEHCSVPAGTTRRLQGVLPLSALPFPSPSPALHSARTHPLLTCSGGQGLPLGAAPRRREAVDGDAAPHQGRRRLCAGARGAGARGARLNQTTRAL